MKFLFWVFLLFPCVSFGGITQKTVHINAGYYITHNNDSFPAIAFNETSLYNQQNFISQINNDDSLIITLVNNDSISHSFYIKTHINIVLSPGETKVDTLALEEGIYSYADYLNNQKVLGGVE